MRDRRRASTARVAVAVAAMSMLVGGRNASGAGEPIAPATATAPAARVTPLPRTFTVAAVGDFLSESVVNYAAAAAARPGVRYDYEPLLRPIAEHVRFADLAICHMETPIGAPGDLVGFAGKGPFGFNKIVAAWESASDLRRVGFDRCSTASNHAYDLGIDGIRTTLQALDAAKLSHDGTARTPAEAAVSTFLVNDIRVAHLSYTQTSNGGFPAEAWRLARAVTPARVVTDVRRARQLGAEVVIVSLHVIAELSSAPTPGDRTLVTGIVDGAHPDLVLVHGPHTPQPFERVHGTVVYWSLGNLISGMGQAGRKQFSDPRSLDGLLASVRFTERRDGTWAVAPWTVLLCNVTGSRKVYAGITHLTVPGLDPTLRSQLRACVSRASSVVSGLH